MDQGGCIVRGDLLGMNVRQKVLLRSERPVTDQAAQFELWYRPPHDRHRADAVLRATLDNPIAVCHVNQHIALAVEEAHDLKTLEHEAGVTRVLRHAQSALHPSRLRPGDVTGDALDFGVVEGVDHDLVVGPDPAKMRADRAGRAAFGATENPPSEVISPSRKSAIYFG